MNRLRRILRIVADFAPVLDVRAAEAIALQEFQAEPVLRRLLALTGEPLGRFASDPQCGYAVGCRLLSHLDERAGELSLSRFLELSAAAVTIAERIAPCAASLRVRAWQKQGQALARKGLFNDAERSFDVAERNATQTAAPEYYGALVRYARAATFHMKRRPDQAERFLGGLADTFLKYGDVKRARYSRELHGIVLQHFGHLREALATYREVEPAVRATGTRYDIANLEKSIALCLVEMGEAAEAREYLSRAMPVLISMGQDDAVAKVDRVFARRDQDAPRLREIATKFYNAGALGEYIITVLDALATELATSPGTDIVGECHRLAEEAATCGLERHVTARLKELEAMAVRNELSTTFILGLRRDLEPNVQDIRIVLN